MKYVSTVLSTLWLLNAGLASADQSKSTSDLEKICDDGNGDACWELKNRYEKAGEAEKSLLAHAKAYDTGLTYTLPTSDIGIKIYREECERSRKRKRGRLYLCDEYAKMDKAVKKKDLGLYTEICKSGLIYGNCRTAGQILVDKKNPQSMNMARELFKIGCAQDYQDCQIWSYAESTQGDKSKSEQILIDGCLKAPRNNDYSCGDLVVELLKKDKTKAAKDIVKTYCPNKTDTCLVFATKLVKAGKCAMAKEIVTGVCKVSNCKDESFDYYLKPVAGCK